LGHLVLEQDVIIHVEDSIRHFQVELVGIVVATTLVLYVQRIFICIVDIPNHSNLQKVRM